MFKDPITDPGKKSKKGHLTLERTGDGGWVTVCEGKGSPANDQLVPVFENGVLLKEYTFDEVWMRFFCACGRVCRVGPTCGSIVHYRLCLCASECDK